MAIVFIVDGVLIVFILFFLAIDETKIYPWRATVNRLSAGRGASPVKERKIPAKECRDFRPG